MTIIEIPSQVNPMYANQDGLQTVPTVGGIATAQDIHEVTVVQLPRQEEATTSLSEGCSNVACCCCYTAANICDIWSRLVFNAWEWKTGGELRQNGTADQRAVGTIMQLDAGGVVGIAAPQVKDQQSDFILNANAAMVNGCCELIQNAPECIARSAGCCVQTAATVVDVAIPVLTATGQCICCILDALPK